MKRPLQFRIFENRDQQRFDRPSQNLATHLGPKNVKLFFFNLRKTYDLHVVYSCNLESRKTASKFSGITELHITQIWQ